MYYTYESVYKIAYITYMYTRFVLKRKIINKHYISSFYSIKDLNYMCHLFSCPQDTGILRKNLMWLGIRRNALKYLGKASIVYIV